MNKQEIAEAKRKLDAYKDKVEKIAKFSEDAHEESSPNGRMFGPDNEFQLKQTEKEIKDSKE